MAGVQSRCKVLDYWCSLCVTHTRNSEDTMTAKERIEGRRIGIVGMARSGVAAACLARRHGGLVFVSDSASDDQLQASMKELAAAGIEFETGGHSSSLLDVDYIVVSPGVPLEIDILKQARERGLPVFSEIELASWVCPGKIVAITGSNGKTTTSVIVGELLQASQKHVFVCGNIGLPFSEIVDMMDEQSIAVIEVSSFQLLTIEDFRPHLAAILNITPDHLDRHGSFADYREAKYRITENQTADDYLVLSHDDDAISSSPPETLAITKYCSSDESKEASTAIRDKVLCLRQDDTYIDIMPIDDIQLPGRHNLQNIAFAIVLADILGVKTATMSEVLRKFPGVEHRLEDAGSVAGVRFINDSKATNVESTCVALQAVSSDIYLIVGGRDKGSSYQPIVAAASGKIKGIVAIGEAKEKIFDQLGQSLSVEFAASLQEAVTRCFSLASPGETVLLSPACASFDMFDNFEERGRIFKEAVKSLNNGKRKSETVSN